MKKLTFFLFAIILWTACQNDKQNADISNQNLQKIDLNGLSLNLSKDATLHYDQLRLYPVVADAALINAHAQFTNIKLLQEGMQTTGFRVLERKQFGRSEGNWYHGLTVQNKSSDTILILSGDIVKGGNQDRVLAYHDMITPRTVKNVEVYCVEQGRSTYYNPIASASEKEAGAFAAYYNVASPSVRRAVQCNKEQDKVWSAVAEVTKANKAESTTSAYTALDAENEQKTKRDAYMNYFENKLSGQQNVVGIVAVSGDKIIGIDIFSHPNLFKKAYSPLLHGYIAEAATQLPGHTSISDRDIQQAYLGVASQTYKDATSSDVFGNFTYAGNWVHVWKK